MLRIEDHWPFPRGYAAFGNTVREGVVDLLYGLSAAELRATFRNVSRPTCSFYSTDLSLLTSALHSTA